MKEKTVILFVVILIAAFSGFIFILGEKVISEESSIGFSTFYFTSDDHSADKYQDLDDLIEIKINNHELSAVEYELIYSVNGAQLEKSQLILSGGESRSITAPGKIIDYLSDQPEGNYLVKIGIVWNSSNEYLIKNIIMSNASKK